MSHFKSKMHQITIPGVSLHFSVRWSLTLSKWVKVFQSLRFCGRLFKLIYGQTAFWTVFSQSGQEGSFPIFTAARHMLWAIGCACRLTFIDLAGSERASEAISADRQARVEGADINQSLLAVSWFFSTHLLIIITYYLFTYYKIRTHLHVHIHIRLFPTRCW